MKRIKKIKEIFYVLLIATLIFSGCSKTDASESVGENSYEAVSADISEFAEKYEEGEADEYFYNVVYDELAYELPVIDDEWLKQDERDYGCGHVERGSVIEKDGFYFVRRTVKLIGNSLYVLDDICGELLTSYICEDGSRVYSDENHPYRMHYGFLITVFNEDGTTESHLINRFDITEEGDKYIRDIVGRSDDGEIYLYLSNKYYSMLTDFYYGSYREGKGCTFYGKLPDSCRNKSSCYEKGIMYYSMLPNNDEIEYVLSNTQTVYSVDKNKPEDYSFSTYGYYIKGLGTGTDGVCFGYGVDKDKIFNISRLSDEACLKKVELDNLYEDVKSAKFYAAVTTNGENAFVTDGSKLWTIIGETVISSLLTDNDILTEEIYGLSADDNGFRLYARYDGEDVVYKSTLMKGKKTDKKIIRFSVGVKNPIMEEFIAVYNRSNPEYMIVTETGWPRVSDEEYANEIAVQTAAGNAPELIDDLIVPPLQPCRNGTYAVLDDLIAECDNPGLIQSVMASGKIGGHQYGIPWYSSVLYCAAPSELCGGRESWNLNECITSLENSKYSYFGQEYGRMMSPVKIVLYLGLYDTENMELIDWSERKSNLEGESFVSLLEFAKKYGNDAQYINFFEDDEQYAEVVKAACQYEDMMASGSIELYEKIIKEGYEFIGFPGSIQSSAYVSTTCIYVNEGSKNKDGAKAFLSYLISKEGQEKFGRIALKHEGYEQPSASIDNVDLIIKDFNKDISGKDSTWLTRNGKIKIEPFTDEMAEAYKNMYINARPIRKELEPIKEIIEEEMEAFLAGQKTAEETAKVIDSRVQIYLDENR